MNCDGDSFVLHRRAEPHRGPQSTLDERSTSRHWNKHRWCGKTSLEDWMPRNFFAKTPGGEGNGRLISRERVVLNRSGIHLRLLRDLSLSAGRILQK